MPSRPRESANGKTAALVLRGKKTHHAARNHAVNGVRVSRDLDENTGIVKTS
jgi:hypothetical protein